MILTILQFLLAFGIMLFLHELGHFLVAKLFKVEVEEFGIGLPPRALKLFTWKETVFSLNWLPFGAFVRPKGEMENDISTGGFKSAHPWQQFLIYLAGPFMNLLTAFVIYSVTFLQVGFPNQSVVLIDKVEPASPAETAGIRTGDQIVTIGDRDVDAFAIVTDYVDENLDQEISIGIRRDGELLSLNVTPISNPPEGRGAMGIVITYPMEDYTLLQSVAMGAQDTVAMSRQYVVGLWQMVSGQLEMGLQSIVGPVGMFSIYEDVARMDQEIIAKQEERDADRVDESISAAPQRTASDVASPWLNRLNFFAIISIALGVTNLLPIPALDGGRILFLLPEMIFRKKLPDKFEYYYNAIGMACLLLLMAVIMFKDIFMIANG